MMEVHYDLSTIFDADLVRLDGQVLKRFNHRRCWAVPKMIDEIGRMSQEAQGLKRVLTSYDKLVDSADQVLYLLWRPKPEKPTYAQVMGILKIGRRQLYLYDKTGDCKQTDPICILDFYVYTDMQRIGHGHRIFDFMLQNENVAPWQTAIDKPSDALLSFLQKHYELKDPIWQITNYVVYPAFFNPALAPKQTATAAIKEAQKNGHENPAAIANGSAAVPADPAAVTNDDADERDSLDQSSTTATPIRRPHTSSIVDNPITGDFMARVASAYSPSPKTRAQQALTVDTSASPLQPASPRASPQRPQTSPYKKDGDVMLRSEVASVSSVSGSSLDLSRQRKVQSMGHQHIW